MRRNKEPRGEKPAAPGDFRVFAGRVFHPHLVQVSSFSVVTDSCLPSTAATTACHGRIAHFTRAGNLCTPANTASLPISPSLTLPVVTMSWTLSNNAFTSAFVFPFNASVRIDADAFEMAQPAP